MRHRKYVDISGLDKAEVFKALYDKAGTPGLAGVEFYVRAMNGEPDELPLDEAKAIIAEGLEFDYVRGRRLKLDLSQDRLYVVEYDECSAAPAAGTIAALRERRSGL